MFEVPNIDETGVVGYYSFLEESISYLRKMNSTFTI